MPIPSNALADERGDEGAGDPNHHGHQEAMGIVRTRQQKASDEACEKADYAIQMMPGMTTSQIRLNQTELELDLAIFAERRLRAVGWLNPLRLVHGLLEMPACLGEVARCFIFAQNEPVARGISLLVLHVPQRFQTQSGILSRRSLPTPSPFARARGHGLRPTCPGHPVVD